VSGTDKVGLSTRALARSACILESSRGEPVRLHGLNNMDYRCCLGMSKGLFVRLLIRSEIDQRNYDSIQYLE
jgi:hypothetical protein